MQPTISPHHLVTINLKFSSKAKPLRTVALAHLIAKALFLSATPLPSKRLAAEVARLIGCRRVNRNAISRGIDYLRELGKVTETRDMWSLAEEARQEIEDQIRRAEHDLTGVLSRHFGTALHQDTLRRWFLDASAIVFSKHSDNIVAVACRGTERVQYERLSIETLLRPVIAKHGQDVHATLLLDGYLSFLSSADISDHGYFMNLVQALFSARLVAADVGVEVLTLGEFRDATILLDTNVLFAIMLEEHRLGKSLRALFQALQQINAQPVYILRSREEYDHALHARREELLRLVESYKREVIEGLQDAFVSTAVARGCRSLPDYERFFDSLQDLPTELRNGYALQKIDDQEIERALKDADGDKSLQNTLQEIALKLRPPARKGKKKSEQSLRHDAGLISIAEAERRKGRRWWVLSLDRSLAACARERTSRNALPAVVGLDALIEILAADGSGPTFVADDFAPLLGRMMIMDSAPPPNAYTTTDLDILRQMNEEAMVVSPELTKQVASLVAKARIEGRAADGTAVQLEVTRVLQLDRITGGVAVDELRKRAAAAETRAAEARSAQARSEKQLIEMATKELRRDSRLRFYRQLAWRVPATIGVAGALWLLTRLIVTKDPAQEFISTLVGLVSAVGFGWKLVPDAWRQYRIDLQGSEDAARQKVLSMQ